MACFDLSEADVDQMFEQYQQESGQTVEKKVTAAVYKATRGHPGLVSWFGELLTEKYNPGPARNISMETFHQVYPRAVRLEWNNNISNLLANARERDAEVLGLLTATLALFVHSKDPQELE